MADYKEIPLTHGKVALVDAADHPEISKHKWYAAYNSKTQSFYAQRGVMLGDRKRIKILRMARVILGVSDPRVLVDHVSGDTLDNRRKNLREATTSQNCANSKTKRNNASGFKGVGIHTTTGKWQARITKDRKQTFLGVFDTPELAHAAYCLAANALHGDFARTR